MYSRARRIESDGGLLKLAIGIPEIYDLRALDSFQLAAAFICCGEQPRNPPFITADHRLANAASALGFDVVSIT
jgi:predicted nucleic acid-binding protein